jgi:hypothetical protein
LYISADEKAIWASKDWNFLCFYCSLALFCYVECGFRGLDDHVGESSEISSRRGF